MAAANGSTSGAPNALTGSRSVEGELVDQASASEVQQHRLGVDHRIAIEPEKGLDREHVRVRVISPQGPAT